MTSEQDSTRTRQYSIERTNGECVVCARSMEVWQIGIGSGRIQLCDDCKPYIKKALNNE